MNPSKLVNHLTASIPKGGHGFERRNFYERGGTLVSLVEKIHYSDHLVNQASLRHKNHPSEIELEREKLITQYWTGRKWGRLPEPQSRWTTLGPDAIIGDPDLAASLLVIARVFGMTRLSYYVENII
jgi:hypothetical protein